MSAKVDASLIGFSPGGTYTKTAQDGHLDFHTAPELRVTDTN